MSKIELVKQLRQETGAGISDCKKALEESNSDIALAKEYLRKLGASRATKKADRQVKEGLIALKSENLNGVLIELNSETDFVSRNTTFQNLVQNIALIALQNQTDDVEKIKNLQIGQGSETVATNIANHISVLGENISFRRAAFVKVAQGAIAEYVHGALSPGVGRIAALVALESSGDQQKLKEFGKKLAMHIVSMKPASVSIDSLNPEILSKERELIEAEVKAMNKPESVSNKIIEGMISKFYQQTVLLEQIFVIDGSTKISDLLKAFEAEINTTVKIKEYKMFIAGEDIN